MKQVSFGRKHAEMHYQSTGEEKPSKVLQMLAPNMDICRYVRVKIYVCIYTPIYIYIYTYIRMRVCIHT